MLRGARIQVERHSERIQRHHHRIDVRAALPKETVELLEAEKLLHIKGEKPSSFIVPRSPPEPFTHRHVDQPRRSADPFP